MKDSFVSEITTAKLDQKFLSLTEIRNSLHFRQESTFFPYGGFCHYEYVEYPVSLSWFW